MKNSRRQIKKKNFEKFRKAKFNYAKFVKDYYLENGKAYISLKVNGIEDIISKYSVKDYEWINLEFAEYIEECAYYIPTEEAIILEICGGNFNEEEKSKITKIIKDYYGLQLGDKIIDLHINRKRSNILLLFAIITSILLVLMLNYFSDSIFREIMFIAVWFFFWEYGDMAWLDRQKILTEKLEAGQLAMMDIKFVE